MGILITICARGGSKGIPGKNVRTLANKPLIGYSIEIAQQFTRENEAAISLSTDSEEIRGLAARFGLMTDYLRPANLASDVAGKVETIQHLLLYEEASRAKRFDYVLDLDVTSPLRTMSDLEEAFSLFKNSTNALTLFSVNKAGRNPYFNMVEEKGDGFYGLVKHSKTTTLTRQSAPKVYELNASFYFYRREFFDLGFKGAVTDRSLIYEIPHLCFDLDHSIDFEFMEYLMTNNKLDFNFV